MHDHKVWVINYKENSHLECLFPHVNPSWLLFVTASVPFVVCWVVICVLYFRIFQEARKARKQQRQIAPMSVGINTEIKAAKVLGIAISAFLLSLFPLVVYFSVISFSHQITQNLDIIDSIQLALMTIALSNSCMNFIIYAWKNSQFRQAYKRLVRCKC